MRVQLIELVVLHFAQCNMEELKQEEVAVCIVSVLNEAHPVSHTLYFADLDPLFLVELTDSH